jgi:hypothetical protein
MEGPLDGEEGDVEVNEKGGEDKEELELKLKRDGWNRTLGIRVKDDLCKKNTKSVYISSREIMQHTYAHPLHLYPHSTPPKN